jgi:hypothetical protein
VRFGRSTEFVAIIVTRGIDNRDKAEIELFQDKMQARRFALTKYLTSREVLFAIVKRLSEVPRIEAYIRSLQPHPTGHPQTSGESVTLDDSNTYGHRRLPSSPSDTGQR